VLLTRQEIHARPSYVKFSPNLSGAWVSWTNEFLASYARLQMQLSDSQLLLACRRGDESAWESLIQRYQRLIYAIPRRAGLDDDHAAEVFQEVFTTLFKKLNDIEDPARLHAWLVTTARRKTWKLKTKENSWQQFSQNDEQNDSIDELANIADEALLPDEVLLQLEEQHRVRTAVAGLDERCGRLINLLFYQPEPPAYSEIATALAMSEGSIGPTRARCLEKLLGLLEKR
jgi:RNA polymerase sigma factor (sigma-70 family)